MLTHVLPTLAAQEREASIDSLVTDFLLLTRFLLLLTSDFSPTSDLQEREASIDALERVRVEHDAEQQAS